MHCRREADLGLVTPQELLQSAQRQRCYLGYIPQPPQVTSHIPIHGLWAQIRQLTDASPVTSSTSVYISLLLGLCKLCNVTGHVKYVQFNSDDPPHLLAGVMGHQIRASLLCALLLTAVPSLLSAAFSAPTSAGANYKSAMRTTPVMTAV